MTAPADRWGLRTLMTQTLDPAYAEAAGSVRRHPGAARAVAAVVLVVAGLIVGVAFRQQQHQATDRQAARAALIARVDARSSQVSAQTAQLAELRKAVAALREKVLGSSEAGAQLLDDLQAQELLAALTSVTGPGITITIADPKPAQSNDPVGHGQTVSQDGLVTDVDLQRAVNALWASGAEAVAINDKRIGPRTAIRQAGGAVLIDFQPTSSPYVIKVVGNPATLPADFAATEPARRFGTYRSAYGAQYDVQTVDKLTLPPAAEPVGSGNESGGN
ncbi:DUF881 domain-containing protein [Cumulibacter manganitolerans]|uniref:DUF881 domain-containing protein n=1 Tax=Cumulibacter manganitolerans TaxID=1884992 RepID=UPI001295119B|nr:DUF881 domain-containing protein [Cumulibacter manganitolerans]